METNNIESTDFDFSKKITKKVEKQISKIDYSSYKKLAFFALAIGVFVSAGVLFSNNIAPKILDSTTIFSKVIPSNTVVQNLNNQVSSLTPEDFDNTTKYYQKVMNMYDNKLDYTNKVLLQYNLQKSFSHGEVSSERFKDLSENINEHKENITEIINKFNSLKIQINSKEKLSYNDVQFVLNSVENAKQGNFYQNSEVEKQFNINLVSTHKHITQYLMSQNAYYKIKYLDQEIKQSFQTSNISVIKPKM